MSTPLCSVQPANHVATHTPRQNRVWTKFAHGAQRVVRFLVRWNPSTSRQTTDFHLARISLARGEGLHASPLVVVVLEWRDVQSDDELPTFVLSRV